MLRAIAIAAASLMLLTAGPSFSAERCRDAKGKFMKCPVVTTPAAPTKCKDAKGKFAKCGTPGAMPMK